MAEVFEQISRSLSDRESGERTFFIRNAANEQDALNALDAYADTEWNDLFRGKLSIESVFEGFYTSTVPYSKRKDEDEEDKPDQQSSESLEGLSISIDTETLHITQALNTSQVYAAPGLPNTAEAVRGMMSGVIGYDGEKAEGTDILVPTSSFSVTRKRTKAFLTDSYLDTLDELVGKVNANTFRRRKPVEVLFKGCRLNQLDEKNWEIQYEFLVSRERRGFKVGDVEVEIKRGWELLDIRYQEVASGSIITNKPAYVAVRQVYEEADFGRLKL